MMLLTVNDLQITFQNDDQSTLAVENLSFELKRGETLGIVGESGSGKSVTALSLIRLLSPAAKVETSGLFFQEKEGEKVDLQALPEAALINWRGVKMGMIFQEPMTSLNPVFTCGEQVAEALIQHLNHTKATAKAETLRLFERVKLPDPQRIYDAFPHQLSGGQKQRVMIAAAISCQPDLLLADEPTTALDVTVQQSILDLLKDLQQEMGMSILFITHDLGVLAQIADRALVMHRGKIVERGTIKALFSKPQHPYTKALLACRPPLEERWKRLPTITQFLEEKENNTPYQPTLITAEETEARLAHLQTKTPLINVENLTIKFPKTRNFFGKTTDYIHAVDDISFQLFPGETLGVVGESGSGKTTLGRGILRLVDIAKGTITWKGEDIAQKTGNQLVDFRKQAQIIFQDPYSSLNPKQTIGASLVEPMQVHGLHEHAKQREAKAYELLKTVQLEAHHFDRFPHEFSGGQRQRICIARALAVEPTFLVCDECVSALDVSVQASILNLLIDLREQFNLSYLFISHDLSVVRFMSDRMLVMKSGKIVEHGAADAIYHAPQNAYTQALIGAIPKGL